MFAAWNRSDTPPDINPDIGFHYDLEDVELAVFGLEQWGVLPFAGGLFDQPEFLLSDIFRYLAARHAYERESDGVITAPPDAYEDLDDDTPRMGL